MRGFIKQIHSTRRNHLTEEGGQKVGFKILHVKYTILTLLLTLKNMVTTEFLLRLFHCTRAAKCAEEKDKQVQQSGRKKDLLNS